MVEAKSFCPNCQFNYNQWTLTLVVDYYPAVEYKEGR